jgi:hypothetical protein
LSQKWAKIPGGKIIGQLTINNSASPVHGLNTPAQIGSMVVVSRCLGLAMVIAKGSAHENTSSVRLGAAIHSRL